MVELARLHAAGVEAWNGIRALDYLQSRPEVDGERLGVTGRSGGGAYSWWIAALDERIKAAVPVAGITDLQNQVVDGCVEGHCDCMFMVNTYRWDFPQVAALVAPRALLIANTDKDSIFPLDGVERLHAKVRRIYQLHGADDKLGLQISEGPHKDTQELQVATMHWFNRFLKGEDSPVENTGIRYFEPEQLRVFRDGLPADEITSKIHETFVPAAPPPKVPETQEEWERQRDEWMAALKEKCFRGWPEEAGPLNVEKVFSVESNGLLLEAFEFDSQELIRLRLYVWRKLGFKRYTRMSFSIGSNVSDAELCALQENFPEPFADMGLPAPSLNVRVIDDGPGPISVVFLPRGLGRNQWDMDPRKQVQIRRRFMLLGQTLAGMQVWDVRRALQAVHTLDVCRDAAISFDAKGEMAVLAIYASLFEPPLAVLNLENISETHGHSVDFLNVLRFLDVPQATVMAAERTKVCISQDANLDWPFAGAVAKRLEWARKRLSIEDPSTIPTIDTEPSK